MVAASLISTCIKWILFIAVFQIGSVIAGAIVWFGIYIFSKYYNKKNTMPHEAERNER